MKPNWLRILKKGSKPSQSTCKYCMNRRQRQIMDMINPPSLRNLSSRLPNKIKYLFRSIYIQIRTFPFILSGGHVLNKMKIGEQIFLCWLTDLARSHSIFVVQVRFVFPIRPLEENQCVRETGRVEANYQSFWMSPCASFTPLKYSLKRYDLHILRRGDSFTCSSSPRCRQRK